MKNKNKKIYYKLSILIILLLLLIFSLVIFVKSFGWFVNNKLSNAFSDGIEISEENKTQIIYCSIYEYEDKVLVEHEQLKINNKYTLNINFNSYDRVFTDRNKFTSKILKFVFNESFDASIKIILKETASPKFSEYFNIFISIDNQNWTKINKLNEFIPVGNSNEIYLLFDYNKEMMNTLKFGLNDIEINSDIKEFQFR